MLKNKLLLPVVALLSLTACSSQDILGSSSSIDSFINSNPITEEHRLNNPNKAFNNKHQSLNEEYVSSVKEFALDFYSVVADDKNAIFSPLSIATCYSMLYEGALENSKAELEKMLHYSGNFNHLEEIKKMLLNNALEDKESELYLDLNQSMWIDNSFKDRISKSYVEKLEDYYFAEAYKGWLESDEMHGYLADYINEKTRGFLNVKKEVFKDYAGILWLLNTIYLKTQWSKQFDDGLNKKDNFQNIDGSKKEVTFMNKTEEASYFKTENYMISSIPLKGNMNFTVLLPNEGTDYQKVLTDKSAVSAMIEYYNTRNHIGAEISYKVPQFKVQTSYELNEVLPNLGVVEIFDDDRANLTGLADIPGKGNMYVERSKHEAGIEVGNEGLEAAAYTIIEVDEKSAAPSQSEKIKFVLDHPFSYVITSRDGLPLFMGTVNNL